MGWKDDTRRALVGPQVWLQTSAPEGGKPTLWIRPKKWGMAAKEAIDAFRKQVISSKESRGNVRRFGELMKKCQADEAVDYSKLTQDELEEFMDISIGLEVPQQQEIIRLALESAVGDHNFLGDDEKPLNGGFGLPAQTVQELLNDWAEMAIEMFQAVQRWNTPLGQQGSEKSGRSPGGSSTEPSLQTTRAPSQTGPSPSS